MVIPSFFAFSSFAGPVSYTHLDVYKRQFYGTPFVDIRNKANIAIQT